MDSAPTDSRLASLAALTGLLEEPATAAAARARADEHGLDAPSPTEAALLRLLVSLSGASHVVELGGGGGVGLLWLLSGMSEDGVVTSIDSDPEHQRLAREALAEAHISSARARLIAGRPLEVLPRLTDGGYDLLVSALDPGDTPSVITEARRLLRPGGVVVLRHVDADGRAGERLKQIVADLEQSRAGIAAVLPLGNGMVLLHLS